MNVLLIACSQDVPGGVAAFVRMLMRHASPEINYDYFVIGDRQGNRSRLLKILRPVLDGFRLIALLRRKSYEAAHINPSLNMKSVLRDGLFIIILHAMGIGNSLVFFHGWNQETQETINSNRLLKKLFTSVFSTARQIGVLSGRFRNALIAMGFHPEKIVVFTTMFDGQALTVDHKPRKRNHQLLFISRLVKAKGCQETLEAFQLLCRKYPALELIIAGDGPELENLVQLSRNMGLHGRVRFLGYITGREKAKVLNEAGILVFPTYYGEGCPIILLEAMGAGMGIVTSMDGGIPDILESGRDASLLEDVAPRHIAAAVDELLSNPHLLDNMQNHNRQRAWDCFEAGIVSRRIQKVY